MRRYSLKRQKVNREYLKIVVEMMAESNECEIKEEGCSFFASGLHHKKKRSPATITDRRFLIRACDNCNEWCERNPKQAIEKGYSISKHKVA